MRIIHRAPLAMTAAVLLTGTVAVPVAGAAPSASAKPVVKKVTVADDFYSPMKLTIKAGDKVNFVWSPTNINVHDVTLVSGPKGVSRKQFTSLDGSTGFHFERTLTVPGKYHFQCTIHPSMMNTIITVKK